MMKYKYIILSDIHLGINDSKAKELLDFIENNTAEHIILNGDIIDGWAIKRGSKIKKSHTKIIAKLLKLSYKTKITWIRGNHDNFIEEFIGTKLGNIEILEDYIIELDNNDRYYIFHGDLIDIFITKYKWLSHVGSIGYDIALWVNRIYNKYRSYRGLKYYSISDKIKKSVKIATNYINDFEITAINIAKTKDCTGVICGHIHNPEIRLIEGMSYINSGDWIENLTAITIDFNNKIEIVSYNHGI